MSQESDATLWLAEEWSRQIARAVESMTGESALISFDAHTLEPAEVDAADSERLWWEQPFSLGPDAIIWVGAPSASWQEIGNRVLRSAGVDDASPDDIRGTYLKIVNQSLSGVASAITTRVRKEVACTEGSQQPPPASARAAAFSFEMTLDGQVVPLLAVFSVALAGVSDSSPAEQASAKPGTEERPRADVALAKAAAASPVDLLLDVELPVSVSFGRAQLMLKDVIKLTTGSIVELNRTLSEPVEVIVNNCVIARGEVVVVEGNYGIRIKQVISRRERLRTLY